MHDAISAMFIEPADLKTRILTNALTFLSLHRSVAVLVPSESARRDVQRIFKVPARKIFVTPYGVSDMFRPVPKDLAKKRVAERFGIEGRFILTVNFFRPRKNAPVLAAAFRELKRRAPVDRLVFVGAAPEPLRLTILNAAKEQAKGVVFTGYLPDEWLPTFYSAAEVFAFPSRYEGFGLPVLEAMACGIPVVAGDAPAVNEIAKGVALLVPPNDWLALADALERVLTDEGLAEDLCRRGLTLAASFTWERTASLTWQVYRRFVESSA
jgi:glycosyltransferase involved in cell wall biosynthesis